MIRENFIFLRMVIAFCKFLKCIIRNKLVVLNLIFLWRIHRLFWIKSHSPLDFNTAFGTDDSPNVCRIRCMGDWTIIQNCFTSFWGQWSTFVRFPIAPSRYLQRQKRSIFTKTQVEVQGSNPGCCACGYWGRSPWVKRTCVNYKLIARVKRTRS